MELDELCLQSGNDIPFGLARITIHQPTIKEIGLIGEENFHIGSRFLTFDKNNLNIKDKSELEKSDDFEIFMSVMNSRDKAQHKTDAIMVLALLFPEYKIKIEKDKILLQLNKENFSSSINEQNFIEFKSIITQIFCLNRFNVGDEFNPADDLAAKVAEKIKKGREKRAKTEPQKKVTIFSKYISILSVGLQKDKNDLLNYTVPQLIDEFERYILKQDFDLYVKAKLAGAKDLEEVKNWMEDLHS